MSLLKGPRLLVLVLVFIYAGFIAWYDGRGPALTPAEIEGYIERIKGRAAGAGVTPDETLLRELRQLAVSDDGKEFFMFNLINYRAQALYPPGSPYGGTGLEADARYNQAIIPLLLRHGHHPVFVGTPQGRFIDVEGDVQWQRVALVRYRSRRDLLEMVLDLAGKPVGIHKWASIEKTQVFPVHSMFDLLMLRGCVAVLLALIGLGLHCVLRRRAFYSKPLQGAHS